ncbi:MAG: transcriptional regulator [Segetibacter sp.]|nr:transcriptional regulator [Segetibacter sp.]
MEKHFLLAEDDEDDIEIFREATQKTGLPIVLTTVVYCDGIFSSIAVAPLPDLIILDGHLPGKSLLECITEIRANEKLRSCPLVVLSNSNYRLTREESYRGGINVYLQKPYNFGVMEDLFRRLYYIDWSSIATLTSDEFYALAI